MNNIPNNEEIINKLEKVAELISGDNVEKKHLSIKLFHKKSFRCLVFN